MAEKPPVVLTIAGFDPSSGAGITADIKTIAAHGCYGVACITALTVQSTAVVANFFPRMRVFDLPFMFPNVGAVYRVVDDGAAAARGCGPCSWR